MSAFEMIQAQLDQGVPFAKHAGVAVTKVAAGEGRAELAEAPERLNHIATMHAGALFTLGEAASGAAMAGAFAERLMSVRPVAADARIAYKKIARGKISASAKTNEDAADLLKALDANGRVKFDVDVSLTDENQQEVATMTVAWHVKKT